MPARLILKRLSKYSPPSPAFFLSSLFLIVVVLRRRDREHFLEDLEEDPELWKQVNLYQDEDASSTLSDSEVEDFPGPKMNDLIRGMEEMQVDDMEMDD